MTPTERVAAYIRLMNAGDEDQAARLRDEVPVEDQAACNNLKAFCLRTAPILGLLIESEARSLNAMAAVFFGEIANAKLGRYTAFDQSQGRLSLEEVGTTMARDFRCLDALRVVTNRCARILGVDPADLLGSYGLKVKVEVLDVLAHIGGPNVEIAHAVMGSIEHQLGHPFEQKASLAEIAAFARVVEV